MQLFKQEMKLDEIRSQHNLLGQEVDPRATTSLVDTRSFTAVKAYDSVRSAERQIKGTGGSI